MSNRNAEQDFNHSFWDDKKRDYEKWKRRKAKDKKEKLDIKLGKKKHRDNLLIICDMCKMPKSAANIARHKRTCNGGSLEQQIIYEKFELSEENKMLREKISQLELENQHLRQKLEEKGVDVVTFEEIANSKSLNTKLSYQTYWHKYEKYCLENSLQIDKGKSVIEFLNFLGENWVGKKSLRPSSRTKIRRIIIYIIKCLYGKDVSCLIPKKFPYVGSIWVKPKYAMSNDEIVNLLVSLKDSPEDFWCFYILLFSACRVSGVAWMRLEHITDGRSIQIYDVKKNTTFNFEIQEPELQNFFRRYLATIKDEGFVFYHLNHRKKADRKSVV
jgi:hypothetical protein